MTRNKNEKKLEVSLAEADKKPWKEEGVYDDGNDLKKYRF